MANKSYKYFFFSREQISEKNEILGRRDKEFKPGYVVINGNRKPITQITSDKERMSRYVDVDLITEGYEEDLVFTKPEAIFKQRG